MDIDPDAGLAAPIRAPHLECWPTVMVTGHRPRHLTGAEAAWAQVALHRTAWRLRSAYGTQVGISGMALGADTWWALGVLASGMRLHAFIPFEDQAEPWPEADRALWCVLRRRAAAETIVGGQTYDIRMLHARNDAMLAATDDAGGLVVTLYKPEEKGGTASAVAKARRRRLPLLILDPCTRTISRDGW